MTTTEQKWFERVSTWRASGVSAVEFSLGKDFRASGLRHWAYLLKRRGLRPEASSPLVRIARVERSPTAAPTLLTIEIGGARVSVPPGFDEETVRTVIGALVNGARGGAR